MIIKRPAVWIGSALFFCIAFGLCVIANVNMGGDGDWYWYAKLLRGGSHLYSGLNFTLQPLYVIETAWFQDLFGESWIASKIPAVLQLVALSVCMFVLAKQSAWSGPQKAVVLLCAFFFGIRPEWYRFDDYHVLTDVFIIFSAIVVLRIDEARRTGTSFALAVTLGILAGLAFTTRLNDGAALCCFSMLAVTFVAKAKRVLLIASVAASFAVTVLVVIALSGDSLVSWATVSVLQAGSLKGGNGQFITDPVRVLITAWVYVWSPEAWAAVGTLAIALCWTFLVEPSLRKRSASTNLKLVIGAIAIAICAVLLASEIATGNLLYAVLAVLLFGAYAFTAYIAIRAVLHFTNSARVPDWHPREIVLLLPFAMIGSTSLSSAGYFYDLYMPIAVLILLVPFLGPFRFGPHARTAYTAIAALLAISGIWYKGGDPSSWISYRTSPLFVNRQLVDHPAYGPMIADKTLLRFVDRICTLVQDGDRPVELVSVPWPYANYYCHIPPWHDFVQTWFDTTNKREVDALTTALEFEPPKWILYQRQLGTLTYHEQIYNGGHGLPQRSLDDAIMAKIDDGEWRVVLREQYGTDSDWILARTSTSVSHGANLLSDATATPGLRGWHQSSTAPNWSIETAHGGALVARSKQGDFATSTLSHAIKFPSSGAVSVSVSIDASGVNTYVGGVGYSVDLYDQTTGTLVGSLGASNADVPLRTYRFDATVNANDAYVLRLNYGASDGTVSFSALEVSFRNSNGDSGTAVNSIASRRSIATTNLNDWTMSVALPQWSPGPDGSFAVQQTGDTKIESDLVHPVAFAKKATVTVQARIGADSLESAGGFGYIVDLYDSTTDTVAGSIGIPAQISPLRPYSFTARVDPSNRYTLRLRFQGSSGNVTFAKPKIEYGTSPTNWSDEASKP